MKIRTEADRQALDQRIQTELGVDVGKYRDVGIRVIQAPIGILLGLFGALSYFFVYLIN